MGKKSYHTGQRRVVLPNDPHDVFVPPHLENDPLNEPDREALAALLDDLPEYVCLVFVYDLIEYKPDARTKLAAALKRNGSVVKFTRQDQGDLVDWIRRRFRALDHDIDSELARYLIFQCGDLMTGLIPEIGKIGAYAKGVHITRQDIDAVATPQLDAVVFRMTDAIGEGKFDQAASVLGELYQMQEPPIKIMWSLGRQMRQLYSARLALEQGRGPSYVAALWGHQALPGGKAGEQRPALHPGLVPQGGGAVRPGGPGHEVHRSGRSGTAHRPAVGAGHPCLAQGGTAVLRWRLCT